MVTRQTPSATCFTPPTLRAAVSVRCLASLSGVSDLEQAVRAVVVDCMGVREGDEVLVVCNPATIGLGERLRGEAGAPGPTR